MFILLFNILAEEASGNRFPWWVWLILIIILLVILWFWFGKEDEETLVAAEPKAKETPAVAAAPKVEAAPTETEEQPEPEFEVPSEPDDLKKIEGIGPKVSSLLNQAGITTYAHLADTGFEKLKSILAAAKLQYMNPSTWAEQAKLAANGDWETLQILQDELSGGKR